MANVSDLQRKLKLLVISLQKCVECQICSKTVKVPFKVCVSGHGACLECITKVAKCPLCQESFILENLVCIKSILEALPPLCRYSNEGCEEVLEPGKNHENFCGYRPIVCRTQMGNPCSAKVTLYALLEHYRTEHPEHFDIICNTEFCNRNWQLNHEMEDHYYLPVWLFNTWFWVLLVNDVKEKQIKIWFQATPIGMLEHNYYLCIKFENNAFSYSYTLKASVMSFCESKYEGKVEGTNGDGNHQTDQTEEQYCMKLPNNELSRFTDDGKLKFSCLFFRE